MLKPQTVRSIWEKLHDKSDKDSSHIQFRISRQTGSRKVRLWGRFGPRATVVGADGNCSLVIVSKRRMRDWLVKHYFDDIPGEVLNVSRQAV